MSCTHGNKEMSFLRSVQNPGRLLADDDYKCIVCGTVYHGSEAAMAVGVGINCANEPPDHPLKKLADGWRAKAKEHANAQDAQFTSDWAMADVYSEVAKQLEDAISKLDRGLDDFGIEYFRYPKETDEKIH
jgi:hypothetical protein